MNARRGNALAPGPEPAHRRESSKLVSYLLQCRSRRSAQQRDRGSPAPDPTCRRRRNEPRIGSIHGPAGDAARVRCATRWPRREAPRGSQVTRQRRRDAISSPVRHRGEHEDIAFSNRANAAVARAAAILAVGLDFAHRFLDQAAADLVAAIADTDGRNAVGLGVVGEMVGALRSCPGVRGVPMIEW